MGAAQTLPCYGYFGSAEQTAAQVLCRQHRTRRAPERRAVTKRLAVAETGESAMTAARACERKSTVTAIRILKEISFISMCVI